jgi:hypothetical protein
MVLLLLLRASRYAPFSDAPELFALHADSRRQLRELETPIGHHANVQYVFRQ